MNFDNSKETSSFVLPARPKGRQTADRRKIRRRGPRKLATILFSIASAGTDARAVRPPARANWTPGADPAPPLPGNARPLRPSRSPITLYNPGACRTRPAAPRF